MKITELIKGVEKAEKNITEITTVSRRDLLNKFGKGAAQVALASLPFALSALSGKKAYAQSNATIIETLNFALVLEYLETFYYTDALNTAGLIPAQYSTVFNIIRRNESNHVTTLDTTVRNLGGTPLVAQRSNYDYTAGGLYSPFTDFGTFLTLSQAFEDTGVRAYKGQAGNVMSNDDVLTAALNIHSVEARHVAVIRHIRSIEKPANATGQKPWITRNLSYGAPSAVYAGEDNTAQAGVNITNFIGIDGATEAFDEALTKDQVIAIATPFTDLV